MKVLRRLGAEQRLSQIGIHPDVFTSRKWDTGDVLLAFLGDTGERKSAGAPSPFTATICMRRSWIDLSVTPADESEWAVLLRSIEPLLEGVRLSELVQDRTHQDISFLAQELGQSTETLMRVAISARLAAAYDIPAPAFYAFLRQRVRPRYQARYWTRARTSP